MRSTPACSKACSAGASGAWRRASSWPGDAARASIAGTSTSSPISGGRPSPTPVSTSRTRCTGRTRAAAAGIKIVLATGRRYSRALPLVEPLGIDAPIISSSGALVKQPHDHQTLFRAHLERDALCDLLAVVDRAGYDAILYGDTFHE